MCLINMGAQVLDMAKFLSSVPLVLGTNIVPAVPFHVLIDILVVALQWNVFALISLHLEVVGHASSFAKDLIAMLGWKGPTIAPALAVIPLQLHTARMYVLVEQMVLCFTRGFQRRAGVLHIHWLTCLSASCYLSIALEILQILVFFF